MATSPPAGTSGAFSIDQPATATAKPPPIRNASIEIPKKFSTGAPTKKITSSVKNTFVASCFDRIARSASLSDCVRSRNTNAMPNGLMMPIRPVKPNRISGIRRSSCIAIVLSGNERE